MFMYDVGPKISFLKILFSYFNYQNNATFMDYL